MPNLTIPFEYQIIWTALEAGLTPNEFRMLGWHEQAELLAFYKVKGKIDSYYQDYHKQKREEIESENRIKR